MFRFRHYFSCILFSCWLDFSFICRVLRFMLWYIPPLFQCDITWNFESILKVFALAARNWTAVRKLLVQSALKLQTWLLMKYEPIPPMSLELTRLWCQDSFYLPQIIFITVPLQWSSQFVIITNVNVFKPPTTSFLFSVCITCCDMASAHCLIDLY